MKYVKSTLVGLVCVRGEQLRLRVPVIVVVLSGERYTVVAYGAIRSTTDLPDGRDLRPYGLRTGENGCK